MYIKVEVHAISVSLVAISSWSFQSIWPQTNISPCFTKPSQEPDNSLEKSTFYLAWSPSLTAPGCFVQQIMITHFAFNQLLQVGIHNKDEPQTELEAYTETIHCST